MKPTIISIIGAGNMGSSLIGGLIKNGHPPENIWAADESEDKLQLLKYTFNINVSTNNIDAIKSAHVVIFAVKPQVFHKVASQLAAQIHLKHCLIISIAAGIRESKIQAWLGGNVAIVRCMPNTPALIRCGATALYANKFVTNDQQKIAEKIMLAVGIIVWLQEEKQLDIVTAISGSGPAYFFLMMEALEVAAIELGLDANIAHLLTLQTALGSARMALETSKTLVQLRENVTSPGGTTEKALSILETNNLRSVFRKAVHAAKIRSEELAELID